MVLELSLQLQKAKGKKVYGYLPQTARNLVNNIVDELAKDERLSQLYALWYDQRDAVIRTYQSRIPDRVPLSQNETFRSIKNAVIQEALRLSVSLPIPDAKVELLEVLPNDIPVLPRNASPQENPLQHPSTQAKENIQRTSTNRTQTPVAMAGFRLMGSLARMFQQKIQQEQKRSSNLIDRKLRQKIEEKKQAQGLKMG